MLQINIHIEHKELVKHSLDPNIPNHTADEQRQFVVKHLFCGINLIFGLLSQSNTFWLVIYLH
jgi:hypothetical protein